MKTYYSKICKKPDIKQSYSIIIRKTDCNYLQFQKIIIIFKCYKLLYVMILQMQL